MKVLLTRDVEKLGKAGTLKSVADGFARNYLIPQGLAVYASPGALKQAETIRKSEEKRQAQLVSQASSLSEKLSGVTLKFQARAGEGGKLYGSITARQIIEALEREVGQSIDKRKLDLREPIRNLGLHTLRVRLATDVNPTFNVLVERDTRVAAAEAVEPGSAETGEAVAAAAETAAE